MTGDAPLLIASLPGRTIEALRQETESARAGGADLAEVRIDRLAPNERDGLSRLFPAALPLLATLRSRAEGGEGPDDPDARRPILEEAGRLPFLWIDFEEDRDRPLADQLRAGGHSIQILSAHLPSGTPATELIRRSRAPLPAGALRKLVVPSSVAGLLGEILPALRATGRDSTVVLTTGPSGPLLRGWSMRLGYPFVYGSLPQGPSGGAGPPVEASQVPVDRLRLLFDGGGEGPIFALVGRPVGHSQSPYLHSRWMRRTGKRGLYLALEVDSEVEFVESLGPLAENGFRGINVTHPWKSAALASATRVGRGAELCGVANCLTFEGEDVAAENTDLVAILRRLEELRSTGRWSGEELAVVGAGGSAAATLAAARELHVPAFVAARSEENAEALAARFGATALREPRAFGLVVHATDVGRSGVAPLEVPLRLLLDSKSHVLDWVYAPDRPEVRSIAEAAGASYEDGWQLLGYQAASSFGIWWGAEPEESEVARTIAEGPCTG